MGAAARRLARERYDIPAALPRYEALYRALL
jgi:hypothetical protein